MSNTFEFHYEGFRTIYSAELKGCEWRVSYKGECVTAFDEKHMAEMIAAGRVRKFVSEGEQE